MNMFRTLTDTMSKYISLIKTFGPSIFFGYFDLFRNLISDKDECLLNIFLEGVSDLELEVLSLLITLSPGTIAIKTDSNRLLIHSLSYAKSELIQLLASYSQKLNYQLSVTEQNL